MEDTSTPQNPATFPAQSEVPFQVPPPLTPPVQHSSNRKLVWLVLGYLIFAAIVGATAYYLGTHSRSSTSEPAPILVSPSPTSENPGVACTMEAKLCPDGSYVGRTGPNCEFSECPSPAATSSALPTEGLPATQSATSSANQ